MRLHKEIYQCQRTLKWHKTHRYIQDKLKEREALMHKEKVDVIKGWLSFAEFDIEFTSNISLFLISPAPSSFNFLYFLLIIFVF